MAPNSPLRCARLLLLPWLIATSMAGAQSHEVARHWPKLPDGEVLGLCAGIGVDSQNRVFVFHRRERKWTTPFPKEPIAGTTVSIFDGASGERIGPWGANRFVMPHGLSIDHEGNVWLTDVGLHQIFKC